MHRLGSALRYQHADQSRPASAVLIGGKVFAANQASK
jgi:hypothetical protein